MKTRRLALVLALLSCGCGGEESSESPPAPEPQPAPDPDPDPAPDPDPDPEPAAEALQILGADRAHLLFLDTATSSWEPERISADSIGPLHAVSFLGCGSMGAARTTHSVGVWDRGGTLVGATRLPDIGGLLDDGQRQSLNQELEAYEADGDELPDGLLSAGPLVRTDDGSLAMDPVVDWAQIHGELGARVDSGLRIALEVPDVSPAPCPRVEAQTLPLAGNGGEAPDGFECAFLSRDSRETSVPDWLGRSLEDVIAVLPTSECGDDEPIPTEPWARIEACFPEMYGVGSGVALCRPAAAGRTLFVGLVNGGVMDGDLGTDLYMLDGNRVTANAGGSAEARVYGDIWVFGGRRQWYVGGPGRPPVHFGRAAPDVVMGPRPNAD